jgi:hypothetical protein
MCHIFFIHLSIIGHLGWFLILIIVKRAIINLWVQMSFQNTGFSCFGMYPARGLLDHMVLLCFVFGEKPMQCFIMAVLIYISSKNVCKFPSSTSSLHLLFFVSLGLTTLTGEMIAQFDLHLPDGWLRWRFLTYCGTFEYLFWKMSTQVIRWFFSQIIMITTIAVKTLYFLCILFILVGWIVCKIFLSFWGLSLQLCFLYCPEAFCFM